MSRSPRLRESMIEGKSKFFILCYYYYYYY